MFGNVRVRRLACQLHRVVGFCALLGICLASGVAAAALTATIEAGPSPVRPGEPLRVALTVGNSDGFARDDVVVTMIYPDGLAYLANAATEGGVCTASVSNNSGCDATEPLVWNLGRIPAGEVVVLTLPPEVDGLTAPGTSIPFTIDVSDSSASQASATATVTVATERVLELSLTERQQAPFQAGDEVTYRLTYGHTATSTAAQAATLQLAIPSGLTFVAASDGGAVVGSTLSWDLGTLLPGAVGERRATFTVGPGAPAGTTIPVEATIAATGIAPTRAQASTVLEAPDALRLAMNFDADPARPGDVLDGAITVSNTGFVDRADVVVELRYPVGLASLSHSAIERGSCVASVSNNSACDPTELLVFDFGTVPAGESVTATLPPLVAASTPPGSIIVLTAEAKDGSGALALASDDVAIAPTRVLELALAEREQGPFQVGDPVTYRLSYGHTATSTAAPGTTLALTVPDGLAFVSTTDGGTASGDTVSWNLGTLLPGQVGERRVTFTVAPGVPAGTVFAVDARIAETDGTPTRVRRLTGVEAPDALRLAMNFDADPARPGDVLEGRVTVSNTGFVDRADVVVALRYPVGLTALAETAIEGGSCIASVSNNSRCDPTELLLFDLGTVPAGESVTVTLPPVVATATPPGSIVSFRASATDGSGALAVVAEDLKVAADRVLELALSALQQAPVQADGQVTYRLSYGHTATSAAAVGAVLRLTVPDGLSFLSASDGGSASGDAVSWSLGNLLPGAVGERRATFGVVAGLPDGTVLKPEALLEDDAGRPTRVEALTRIQTPQGLRLALDFDPDTATPGEILNGKLSIGNTGFVDRADVVVTMRYPVGLASVLENAIEGGSCIASVLNNSRCDATEQLVWSLGTLPAGENVTLTLPPAVGSATAPGSLVRFAARVVDSAGAVAFAEDVLGVAGQGSLALGLTELQAEPIAPGAALTYQLIYGYRGTSVAASDVVLEMPIPEGVSFASASGAGQVVGDVVRWPLGVLLPGDTGERRVTFAVDPGADDGAVLIADAELRAAGGDVVKVRDSTRIGPESPLRIELSLAPDSIEPGAASLVTLAITNDSFFDRADVDLRLRYPVGLEALLNSLTDGGTCLASVANNSRCDGTETLVWSLGTLPSGSTVTRSFSPTVLSGLAAGSVLEFTAWVSDATERSRTTRLARVGFDTDGDGLSDSAEVDIYGTDPLDPDSDGDGLSDGDEINVYNTLPLVQDSDGDGLVDGDEVTIFATDPALADSDGDSVPDGVEIAAGSDPNDRLSVPTTPEAVSIPLPLWSLVLMAGLFLLGARRLQHGRSAL